MQPMPLVLPVRLCRVHPQCAAVAAGVSGVLRLPLRRHRAGLSAIPRGLIDAGRAIGMPPWQRVLYVRLPTMFRIVLPSLGNAFISLFKDTSLATVLAVPELTYGANWIYTNTFRIVETYAVVAPMYLVTGYLLLFGLRLLERR